MVITVLGIWIVLKEKTTPSTEKIMWIFLMLMFNLLALLAYWGWIKSIKKQKQS